MATITFESYVGAPAWTDISTNRVVFSGVGGLATTIAVGAWQDESHLGDGTPGTDQCGANHVPNVKYISGTQFDSGGGTETLNDTNLITTECTMRVHFNDAGAYAASNAQFYCFDATTPATRAAAIDMFAFERGESNTAWTEINNDSGAVGGTGNQLALASKGAAADHYWYMALSASPETAGGKSAFAVGFSMDYS